MKCVLLYTSADDVIAKARLHYAAHAAWAQEFHTAGTLLMIGTFADVQADGAMGIFTSRHAAEEFVSGDPFVVNGVVAHAELRDWNEALTR
jgi:uncharacterized protein YciI